jgi:hypothetical protein
MRYVFRSCLFAGIAWGALAWWQGRPIRSAPGGLVEIDPLQQNCPPRALGAYKEYQLTAVATYALLARVLHTRRYWSSGDDLVPYDVALGWGVMSDQAVLDRLRISQGNRFFFFEWQNESPRPLAEITMHAANVHVIAANHAVAKTVRALRVGQIVAMRGSLVNVTGPNEFHWNTSLRRDDTGNGACEIFYVEDIRVGKTPAVPVATPAPSGAVAARL